MHAFNQTAANDKINAAKTAGASANDELVNSNPPWAGSGQTPTPAMVASWDDLKAKVAAGLASFNDAAAIMAQFMAP